MVVPVCNTIHAKKEKLSTWKQDVLFFSCSMSESEFFESNLGYLFCQKKVWVQKKLLLIFRLVGLTWCGHPPSSAFLSLLEMFQCPLCSTNKSQAANSDA